jgi:hypothetical protein
MFQILIKESTMKKIFGTHTWKFGRKYDNPQPHQKKLSNYSELQQCNIKIF